MVQVWLNATIVAAVGVVVVAGDVVVGADVVVVVVSVGQSLLV